MDIKEKLTPEIIIESTLSYAIQAANVLEKRPEKLSNKKYKYLFLPSGPQYYCGILQALGYILLNKYFTYQKTLFLISDKQTNSTIKIFEEEISYLGIKINQWKKRKSQKISSKLQEIIREHASFIRTLTLNKNFLRATISPVTTRTNLEKELNKSIYKQYNIVFIWWLNQHEELISCMEKDKWLLTKILQNKSIHNYQKKVPELYNFTKLCKQKNKKPDIIAYLNSWQMWAEEKDCSWYACILA